MGMKFAVLGAGAWGTAMAVRLATHARVALWTRSPEHARAMQTEACNQRYLPGTRLPAQIVVSAALNEVIAGADYLIAAVPVAGLRGLVTCLNQPSTQAPLIWLCKGFERGSRRLPHQIVDEAWPQHPPVAVLSGPSFAQEVAAGLPAALTVASAHAEFARQVARDLHDPKLRLYSTTDVIGVELGGAVKNVIAIAAGIADGLGFGLNARAALVTRGLAELTRLGQHLGGRAETFMGLSGMGDLILTCTGELSRNRQLGLRLAAGEGLEAALRGLGHVAEGATTALELEQVARDAGIDMPITAAVAAIIRQDLPPREAVSALLARDLKDEGR